ncbi:MAG TPA: hypothetical protein V6C96_03345 [Vampirovibrionales bacterium]
MAFHLSIEAYNLLEEALGDKEKASKFAQAIETSFTETKEAYKLSTKEELRSELATKEDLEHLRRELDFKLNIVIAIAALAMTFFNPALLDFLARIIGK